MEHCGFDFYYVFLFQTYFIIFVTVSSILKHLNKSFLTYINIFDIFYHSVLLLSILLFSFNVEENHAIDVLREARQKQKTIQQMNSNENGNGSGNGSGNGK